MVAEICLIQTQLLTALCIPETVIWGVALLLLGLIISVFVPFTFAKKLGFGMIIVGVIIAVGLTWFANQWETNPTFQAIVIGIVFFIIILLILAPSKDVPDVKRITKKK